MLNRFAAHLCVGIAAFCGVVSVADATMRLDRTIVRFDPRGPDRQDVIVFNPDTETMYVEVEVLDVINPGTASEEHIRIIDPRGMDLIASPRKMVVQPGGRKLLRLVNLGGHGDVERIFRVNVKPVPGEMVAHRSAIKVLVGFQLLVIVPPAEPVVDLVSDWRSGRLEFENRGTTNVLVYRGVQCRREQDLDDRDTGDCRQIVGIRLYPGNDWVPDLPFDTPVEFLVDADGRASRRRF